MEAYWEEEEYSGGEAAGEKVCGPLRGREMDFLKGQSRDSY